MSMNPITDLIFKRLHLQRSCRWSLLKIKSVIGEKTRTGGLDSSSTNEWSLWWTVEDCYASDPSLFIWDIRPFTHALFISYNTICSPGIGGNFIMKIGLAWEHSGVLPSAPRLIPTQNSHHMIIPHSQACCIHLDWMWLRVVPCRYADFGCIQAISSLCSSLLTMGSHFGDCLRPYNDITCCLQALYTAMNLLGFQMTPGSSLQDFMSSSSYTIVVW